MPIDKMRTDALDSESTSNSDRLICFCHHVTVGQIAEAVAAGSVTLEAIQADTSASTGCGGCEWEVRALLEELNKKG